MRTALLWLAAAAAYPCSAYGGLALVEAVTGAADELSDVFAMLAPAPVLAPPPNLAADGFPTVVCNAGEGGGEKGGGGNGDGGRLGVPPDPNSSEDGTASDKRRRLLL